MEKRGELSNSVIVGMVLVIIGFIILVYFVVDLNIGGGADKQACKLSVLTRGTVPSSAQSYVPLKCTTEKICLSDGNGKCKESFEGEKIVKVDLGKDGKRAIEETTANAMYDCWSMMGEGKIDLFHSLAVNYGTVAEKSVCVICSRIAVDVENGDNVKTNELLSRVELAKFLEENKIPDGERTYLETFTDKQLSAYSRVDIAEKGSADKEIQFIPRQPEMAVVFMQIKPPGYDVVYTNLLKGGITLSGSALGASAAGFGIISTGKKVAGAVKSISNPYILIPTIFAGAVGATYVALNVHEGQVAAAGVCGEVQIPGEGNSNIKDKDYSKKGCSMVEVLPYDAGAINKLCGYIESIP